MDQLLEKFGTVIYETCGDFGTQMTKESNSSESAEHAICVEMENA